MYEHSEEYCLVVVEQGAEWFGSTTETALSEAHERALVVQQPGEEPADLALRVCRRINLLNAGGIRLSVGVIAASDEVSDALTAARAQIAASVLDGIGSSAPKLIFTAPAHISDDGRHQLMALAGSITSQPRGTPVEVSLRFPRPSQPKSLSGVRRIEPAREVA